MIYNIIILSINSSGGAVFVVQNGSVVVFHSRGRWFRSLGTHFLSAVNVLSHKSRLADQDV